MSKNRYINNTINYAQTNHKQTHLDNNHRANILLRGTSKNQSIPLHMHITISIWHDKNRWCIPKSFHTLLTTILSLPHFTPARSLIGITTPQTQRGIHTRCAGCYTIPKFYLAKKCFRLGTFMCCYS